MLGFHIIYLTNLKKKKEKKRAVNRIMHIYKIKSQKFSSDFITYNNYNNNNTTYIYIILMWIIVPQVKIYSLAEKYSLSLSEAKDRFRMGLQFEP